MFEEIGQNTYLNKNFSYLAGRSEFKLFLKFITEDFKIAKKYFENLDKRETPISILPEYLQEYFAGKDYSKTGIKLFKYFLNEISTFLKCDPITELGGGDNLRNNLFIFFQKYINIITPIAVYKKFDAEITNNSVICKNENTQFDSKEIASYFSRFARNNTLEIYAYLILVNTNIQMDIKTMNDEGDIFESFVLQALINAYVNTTEEDLNLYLNKITGQNMRRFSPGKYDWEVSEQVKIIEVINFNSKIKSLLDEAVKESPSILLSGIMA